MSPVSRRLTALAVVAGLVVGAAFVVDGGDQPTPGLAVARAFGNIVLPEPLPRDVQVYRGEGAWVDAYDYAPAYQPGGATPPVPPAAVDEMAASGVRTLFIQAARSGDARSPDPLVDPGLLAAFIVRAHRDGMRVVGWYLPKFTDVAGDLAHLRAIRDFSVLGHRFDGLAVDIEDKEDVPDPADRSARLLDLSTQLRSEAGTEALGAIVLPPVQTEVVNPAYWPAFPWHELAGVYDAWLPMSYWTFRKASSGYHDGYAYNEESVRRLRADLGLPDAPVHPIGGIADLMTSDELTAFAQSLVDTNAVGGSVYDWNTSSEAARAQLAASFAAAPLSSLQLPAPG